MPEQVRIFISHHHSKGDEIITERLIDDLRAAGAHVWVDKDNAPYNDFQQHINEGIAACNYVILVQTSEALKSPWVRLEVDSAIKMVLEGKLLGFIRFIAQRRDSDDVPPLWSPFKAFNAMHGYDSARAELLRALGLAVEGGRRRPRGTRSGSPPPPMAQMRRIKGRTIVLREHHAALEAAVELLENLPELDGAHPPIRLTVQGDTLFKSAQRIHERWSRARIEALKKGWRMLSYWRLDDNPIRTIRWVMDMFVLLQIGRYEPHYFTGRSTAHSGLLRAPYELLLIPKSPSAPAKAMLFFSTNNQDHVDAALQTEDEAFYGLLDAHFRELTSSTRQLFETYEADERARFLEEMEQREQQGAGRLLFKPDLAVLTMPLSFYQEVSSPWIRLAARERWDVGQLIALQEKRLAALEATPRNSAHPALYRDICSKRALRQWVETGTYSAYQSLASELTVEPMWIQEHLKNAIRMLENYPSYEIALLEDEGQAGASALPKAEGAVLTDPLWMVAGLGKEEAVFMEILTQGARDLRSAVNLRFDEAHVVGAFRSYYETLWETHAFPAEANRRKVIEWLRQFVKPDEDL